MRISQIIVTLTAAVKAGIPILLTSAPGEGKSDLVAEVAKATGADLIISHPVVSDPTDAKGLPWVSPDKESATFLPFGDLYQAMKAEKKTIWFLDDLGQASPAVQASFMQLLLARRVNGHVLPDCVTFVAATNRRTDKAGVTGILEPVKSRFGSILELEANLDDWCEWAGVMDSDGNDRIRPEIVSFLRFRPDLLSDFKANADMSQSPSPRTWHNASKMLALDLPRSLEFEAVAGAVGKGAATEFCGYLEVYRSIPDLDSVLKDPAKAPIPKQPNALFAVCVGLAYRANEETFPAITKYSERLAKAERGEFAVLMLRDSIRRKPELARTDAFKKLDKGEIAKLILDTN